MQIRFSLDEEIDRKLIQKISNRAGSGSMNLAAKTMMQEWSKIEDCQILTSQRHLDDTTVSNLDKTDSFLPNNLDELLGE